MFAFPFWAGQITVVLGWVLFRAFAYRKTKLFQWKQEAVQLLFLVNLLVIYRITFHPMEKLDGKVQPLLFEADKVWPCNVNLIPFKNLLDHETRRELLLNITGNSTMFIPTGVMTPLLYKKYDSFRKILLLGFLMSLIIEVLQLPFAARYTDVNDLILNTLGCAAGYGILSVCRCFQKNNI